jgi:hypothetical protein
VGGSNDFGVEVFYRDIDHKNLSGGENVKYQGNYGGRPYALPHTL